jgi:molybdopterin synthase sulfur carrier subunit
LARVTGEVALDVTAPVTQRAVLDALEARYPMLRGTIRDHVTHKRRPFIRFFACEQDLSHESADSPLPELVVTGAEPLLVVGAMAGGKQDGEHMDHSASVKLRPCWRRILNNLLSVPWAIRHMSGTDHPLSVLEE